MSRVAGFLRAHAVTAALAIVVTVWTFPVLNYDVGDGLDSSWLVGLQMATSRHLAFGRAIVFTYGPLGALNSTVMAVPKLGLAAGWFRLLLHVVVAVLVVHRLRSAFGLALGAVWTVPVVWVAATALFLGDGIVTLLILGIAVATSELLDPHEWSWSVVVGAGAVVAFALLWKFDVGIELLVLSLLFGAVSVIIGRWTWLTAATNAVALLASVLGFAVFFWILLGQPIGALPDWVRSSVELARGYGAMALDNGPAWTGPAGWVGFAGVALLLGRRLSTSSRRAQVGTALFVAVGFYLVARQSWTRQDGSHVARFAALLVLVSALIVVKQTRETFLLPAGIGVIIALAGVGGTSPAFLHPARSVRSVGSLFRVTVSAAERRKHVDWGRTIQPKVMQVPQSMLDRLAGHTVHVDPWDGAVAWVYPKIRWQPLPVFQSYVAYTSALDERNAKAAISSSGPQFVLSEVGSVDYRVARFESPETALALLCHYQVVETSTRWQLLARRATSACGAARPLGRASGTSMVVPPARPAELIVARVQLPGDGLRELLWRPRPVTLQLSPDGPRQRFVVGTAKGRHVLSVPACLRDDPLGAGRFASFDTNPYGPLVFSRGASVEFEAIPYRC